MKALIWVKYMYLKKFHCAFCKSWYGSRCKDFQSYWRNVLLYSQYRKRCGDRRLRQRHMQYTFLQLTEVGLKTFLNW